jgi:hypothetical protein
LLFSQQPDNTHGIYLRRRPSGSVYYFSGCTLRNKGRPVSPFLERFLDRSNAQMEKGQVMACPQFPARLTTSIKRWING